MGYSLNPNLVTQRLHLIKPLLEGNPWAWEIDAPDPLVLRRKLSEIREALYIAERYPDRFPDLSKLRKSYVLRIVSDTRIEATPRTASTTISGAPATGDTPLHGLGSFTVEVVPTVAPTTAEEVISAWNGHLPSSDPIHFKQAALNVEEMTKVHDWCADHQPKLMMVWASGAKVLTISLFEIGAAKIIAWVPPGKPQTEEEALDL